jgi:hemoglobin-like flavoprotein
MVVGGSVVYEPPSFDRNKLLMNIHASLEYILQAKDDLAEKFYDRFLTKHPEVKTYFANVDFTRQKIMLTTALMIVERYYASPTAAVEQYLQYLGTKHKEREIPREAYRIWTATMLETMREFHGDRWSSELESQWRAAIDKASELMFEGYDERVTV